MTSTQQIYANSPAFPEGEHGQICGGISVRTYLSAKAMVGILAGWNQGAAKSDILAAWAVQQADALIAELCKPVKTED